MKHSRTTQTNTVFTTTMSAKARTLFALAGVVPLLAPYELLIRPDWPDMLSIAWVLSALVSLGALVVTALLLGVAVFGLNRRVEFDATGRVVLVTDAHLLRRPRMLKLPFADVAGVEVVCHDWSDGPSTYELRLIPAIGKVVDFGNFTSRKKAESIRTGLLSLLTPKENPSQFAIRRRVADC